MRWRALLLFVLFSSVNAELFVVVFEQRRQRALVLFFLMMMRHYVSNWRFVVLLFVLFVLYWQVIVGVGVVARELAQLAVSNRRESDRLLRMVEAETELVLGVRVVVFVVERRLMVDVALWCECCLMFMAVKLLVTVFLFAFFVFKKEALRVQKVAMIQDRFTCRHYVSFCCCCCCCCV